MTALVAPGVCRFAVNGDYGGHDIVNIIDMQIDTTGEIEDRGAACEAQAGILINEWTDSILSMLANPYTAVSVSWLDLNSLTGSVGVRTETSQETWPMPGTAGANGAPGNVALRIDKNTVGARGQRQGRMFMVGFLEAWTSGDVVNQIDDVTGPLINVKLAAFLGDINQTDTILGVNSYDSKMVVVHTVGGVFTNYSDVDSLTVNTYTSTQVRRIRR